MSWVGLLTLEESVLEFEKHFHSHCWWFIASECMFVLLIKF